jgi:predicted transposase/invertase (TIGR01784 family)
MSDNVKAYSDIFVKYLFASPGNEDIVLDFINDVLVDSGFEKISSVRILNPFSVRAFPDDKMVIVDLEAVDKNGKLFNIEVQSRGNEDYKHRALYYWSKLYSKQMSKGDRFSILKPAITINILNFNLIKEIKHYHSWFTLTHNEDKELILTDHLVIHFLELTKLSKKLTDNLNDDLRKWLYFFKNRDKERFENMKKVIEDDKVLEKANNQYEYFSNDKKLRKIYDAYEEWERRYQSDLEIAEKKGIEKGIEKGRKEGMEKGELNKAIETAKKMKEENLPLDLIERITGLTKEEIEKL